MPPIRTNTPLSDDNTDVSTNAHQESKWSRFGSPYPSSGAIYTRTHSGRESNSREASSTVFSEPSKTISSSKKKAAKSRTGVPANSIIVSGIPLRPTIAFDTFWIVAAERKAIDDKRRAGDPTP